MVRIRMQRLGRTHRPFYRISAIDIRTRRNGKVIENLGWYNPMAPEGADQLHLKEDRIREWLSKGAQPSETVMDMLGRHNLLTDKMKAQWETEREMSRLRVACKPAVARAEAVVKTLEEMVKGKKADASVLAEAKAALLACKKTVSNGRIAKAEEFAAQAEAVLSNLNKASEAPAAQTSEESAAG